MRRQIVVFDMDGVLAEVTESYRETVVQTVRQYTGQTVSNELIQDYKNQGGWNNDWELAHQLIRERGVEVEYAEVVREFKKLFFGNGTDGLILREHWIARAGLLERLAARYQLALFTGRDKEEVAPTLARFASGLRFDPIITAEDVQKPKPDPEGLLLIRRLCPDCNLLAYVGDSLDDARAGRAAGVPFIGIASPSNPRYKEVIALFEAEEAIAILEDINQLEAVLPQ